MNYDVRNPYPDYHDASMHSIAYFQGKRIVRDDLDDLYYEIIPHSSYSTADMLNKERVKPISELPKDEQEAIREFVKDID